MFLLLCAEIVTTYIIAANLPVFFPSQMELNEYPLETKHILLNGNSDLKNVYLNWKKKNEKKSVSIYAGKWYSW